MVRRHSSSLSPISSPCLSSGILSEGCSRRKLTAKLLGPLSGSACAVRTGEHKHRAFPSRAATGSLEENMLPLLQYWLSSRAVTYFFHVKWNFHRSAGSCCRPRPRPIFLSFNGLWAKIWHKKKTACSESNPVQSSRSVSTNCPRKGCRIEQRSDFRWRRAKLGNDIRRNSESIATKVCSQIGRKWNAIFESHIVTSLDSDTFQKSLWYVHWQPWFVPAGVVNSPVQPLSLATSPPQQVCIVSVVIYHQRPQFPIPFWGAVIAGLFLDRCPVLVISVPNFGSAACLLQDNLHCDDVFSLLPDRLYFWEFWEFGWSVWKGVWVFFLARFGSLYALRRATSAVLRFSGWYLSAGVLPVHLGNNGMVVVQFLHGFYCVGKGVVQKLLQVL